MLVDGEIIIPDRPALAQILNPNAVKSLTSV